MLKDKDSIEKVAVIGGGLIGAGWAARFSWHGMDVTVYDKFPQAESVLNEARATAEASLMKICPVPEQKRGKVNFTTNLAEAVRDADYVQECGPEKLEIKKSILAEIESHIGANIIIGSSSSGLKPSDIQSDMRHPERFCIAHPFNPVYILPLVEIVGGQKTSDECCRAAASFMEDMGMKPLICPVEADAFIADRLQTAIWRECLWMVNDNIATTQQLDDAIRFGPGLRWAMMGQCFTYYLAGGQRGMRHFLEQFGPALKLPWCHMEAPELTDELIEKFVSQTGQQAGEEKISELEALRDNCLISIMEALSTYDYAAGKVLAEDRRRQNDRLFGN